MILIDIIRLLGISKDRKLHIDLLACETAKPILPNRPSFISSFKKNLAYERYSYLTLTGHITNVYGASTLDEKPEAVLYPSSQHMVTYGELFEPLSSRTKFKNTEAFINIMQLPEDKQSEFRQHAIVALKKYTKRLMDECDETFEFNIAHDKIKQHLSAFRKLDKLNLDIDHLMDDENIKKNISRCNAIKTLQRLAKQAYEYCAATSNFVNEFIQLEIQFDSFIRIEKLSNKIHDKNKGYASKNNQAMTAKMSCLLEMVNHCYDNCANTSKFEDEAMYLKKRYEESMRSESRWPCRFWNTSTSHFPIKKPSVSTLKLRL